MDDLFDSVLARPRFLAIIVGIFSGLATLLAVVGLFSVIAYMVGQRRRELAVRQALGAQVADLRAMIVVQGLRLTAVGLVLGVLVTLAVTRLLQGLLYGIGPWDAATYLSQEQLFPFDAVLGKDPDGSTFVLVKQRNKVIYTADFFPL